MPQAPSAYLTAAEGGYRLTWDVLFTGDETDEESGQSCRDYKDIWEQVRVIVQTLTLIGFNAAPGQRVMERNGSADWKPPERLSPATEWPVATESVVEAEPPVVSKVKELVRAAPPEEPRADPVLRAAIEGKAPFMTKPLAAALTEATPPKERPTLARALGQTAEAIYLWLLERPGQEFTVGEIGRALSHSDYVTANRLKDLDGAALVIKGSRQGQGRHKAWATYRVAEVKPERERKLVKTGSS